MKHCNSCNLTRQFQEFGKDKHSKSGLTDYCKECRNRKQKEYNARNPEIRQKINLRAKQKRKEYWAKPENVLKSRKQHLRKKFGISQEDYLKLFEEQNGVCSICENPESCERNTNLTIDHCHTSGIIRGLLCMNCNRGIGLLKDSPELLKNAATYLEKYK